MISRNKLPGFQKAIRQWYARNGRDLPWRQTRDPYAILISEVMLQQTTVTAVLPYYAKWMRRFTTIDELASASEAEVLRYWEGLGYYSRARNLRLSALKIRDELGGRFPETAEQLTQLPGIGRYTAAAILTFAFNKPVGILEANTTRLFSRVFNMTAPADSTVGRSRLWDYANAIVSSIHPGRFNSALMDLGATVCLPAKPACGVCPVKPFCRARNPTSLPKKRKRPDLRRLTEHHAVAVRRNQILLQPCTERWRGMWMLPRLTTPPREAPIYSAVFAFTHHRITLEAFRQTRRKTAAQERWFTAKEAERLPMPNPHRRALSAVLALEKADARID